MSLRFDPVLKPDNALHEPCQSIPCVAPISSSDSLTPVDRSVVRLFTPEHSQGIGLLVECKPEAHEAASPEIARGPPFRVLVASSRVLRGTSHAWLESVCLETLSAGDAICAGGKRARVWVRSPLLRATGGTTRLGFCWTSPDSELGVTVLELCGAPAASEQLLFVPVARQSSSSKSVPDAMHKSYSLLISPSASELDAPIKSSNCIV